jgi:hypothetical protein
LEIQNLIDVHFRVVFHKRARVLKQVVHVIRVLLYEGHWHLKGVWEHMVMVVKEAGLDGSMIRDNGAALGKVVRLLHGVIAGL